MLWSVKRVVVHVQRVQLASKARSAAAEPPACATPVSIFFPHVDDPNCRQAPTRHLQPSLLCYSTQHPQPSPHLQRCERELS
jgi:hypothetical protein